MEVSVFVKEQRSELNRSISFLPFPPPSRHPPSQTPPLFAAAMTDKSHFSAEAISYPPSSLQPQVSPAWSGAEGVRLGS